MKKFKNLPKQSRPRVLSDELFNQILEDYKNNIPYYKLKEKYGVGRGVIQNNFNFRKIDFQKRIYQRENQKIKENVFRNLSNKEVQYWLGWLASDGAISKSRVTLVLKETDEEILYKFNTFLGENLTIKKIKKIVGNKIYYGSKLQFRNIAIVEFLCKLGITENKSKTLKINFPITFDFLRGVMDGDGYVDSKYRRFQLASASKEFIHQVSDFLNSNDIKHAIYVHKPSGCYSLQVHALPSVFKLCNLLYTNAHIFLKRKYDNAALIRDDLKEKYSKLREPALGILKQASN